MRRRQLNIRFHPHALDRLRERFPGVKKEKLRGKLRYRIPVELKKGVQPDEGGAIKVEVESGRGVWAVCYPSLMGGWEVITIYPENGRRENVEEKARYSGESRSRLELAIEYFEDAIFRSRLELAIEYFEDAIFESDEIIADCSADLKKELSKQKEHFVVAMEAMKSIREANNL